MYWWMFPAAVVLPVWLLAGWIAFDADGWALLWVLFLAMPAVFFGQLVLALLVRARGAVRDARAVSWWDVLGFGAWHAAIVGTGFFAPGWFVPVLVFAIVGGVALFWLTLWQLWDAARGSARRYLRAADGTGYLPPERPPAPDAAPAEVFVITERPPAR